MLPKVSLGIPQITLFRYPSICRSAVAINRRFSVVLTKSQEVVTSDE